MPSWLCKIWNFLANVMAKIIDVVMGAVKQFLDLAVEAISSLAEAVGFSPGTLLLLGAGVLLFFLLKNKKEDDSDIYLSNGDTA